MRKENDLGAMIVGGFFECVIDSMIEGHKAEIKREEKKKELNKKMESVAEDIAGGFFDCVIKAMVTSSK